MKREMSARAHIHIPKTSGERAADAVAAAMGSWRFIIIQSAIVAAWIALNLVAILRHFDPYPFILLNLLFSTQAAYAAPIIMMSQNRQAAKDRQRDDHEAVTVDETADIVSAHPCEHHGDPATGARAGGDPRRAGPGAGAADGDAHAAQGAPRPAGGSPGAGVVGLPIPTTCQDAGEEFWLFGRRGMRVFVSSPASSPVRALPCTGVRFYICPAAKSAISCGVAVSKPTTSSMPASSGSAMEKPLDTMPTTISRAGCPSSRGSGAAPAPGGSCPPTSPVRVDHEDVHRDLVLQRPEHRQRAVRAAERAGH